MTTKGDDLEAVRVMVETLQPFDDPERDRIMRWAREKLGMLATPAIPAVPPAATPMAAGAPLSSPGQEAGEDISSFVAKKAPISDVHFAATVAYYYQFVAPASEKKDAITKEDLIDACRKAPRKRPKTPAQVLVDAYKDGLLDRAERGQYRLNSVGENLVAMVLPGGGSKRSGKKKDTRTYKQPSSKSRSAKKSSRRTTGANRA
jgi:hypothetical protein